MILLACYLWSEGIEASLVFAFPLFCYVRWFCIRSAVKLCYSAMFVLHAAVVRLFCINFAVVLLSSAKFSFVLHAAVRSAFC